MNRTLILAAAALLLLAIPAVGQRIDLSPGGFQPLPQSEAQIRPDGWLIITTTNTSYGGARQCLEFPGEVTGFGATILVPDVPGNSGLGSLLLVPYGAPGCSGAELPTVVATPAIDQATPRGTAVALAFSGTVHTLARSGYVVLKATTASAASFQVQLREPWVQIGSTQGSPDLDPDVTIHVADLRVHDAGGSTEAFEVVPGRRLEQGDILPRGATLVMYVDVVNRGPAFTTSPWSVVLRPPTGWTADAEVINCHDFATSTGDRLTYTTAVALNPNETRRLCAALRPGGASDTATISAETFLSTDSHPGNNLALTSTIRVEPPRDAAPLAPETVNTLSGRRP